MCILAMAGRCSRFVLWGSHGITSRTTQPIFISSFLSASPPPHPRSVNSLGLDAYPKHPFSIRCFLLVYVSFLLPASTHLVCVVFSLLNCAGLTLVPRDGQQHSNLIWCSGRSCNPVQSTTAHLVVDDPLFVVGVRLNGTGRILRNMWYAWTRRASQSRRRM